MGFFDLIWMRRIDAPEVIAAALRHPRLHDRAAVENALSRHFFAPFVHQEVAEGEAFERRAAMSRAALGLDEAIVAARSRQALSRIRPGEVGDLLDEVRRTVTRAMVWVTFGDTELEPVVLAAVADFDRAIKMMGTPELRRRRELADRLRARLSERAPEGTTLRAMQLAAGDVGVDEQIDHVASVLLGTGIIQVTDVVTHALIALSQAPSVARRATDGAVLAETIRRFPVNASLTRKARGDVEVEGVRLRAGEALTVVPMTVNRRGWSSPERFDPDRHERERGACFGFGHGPRACPARRLAMTMAEVVLGAYRQIGVTVEPGYRHRRSLAMPPRARLGPGACAGRSRQQSARRWLRYLRVCAVTYPGVAMQELSRMRAAQGPPPKMPPHSLPH